MFLDMAVPAWSFLEASVLDGEISFVNSDDNES
jgi:hypothetical protein